MHTNIQELNTQRLALEAELANSPDDAMGGLVEQLDSVMERLSFEQPKTARDITAMLDAAMYFLDLAINSGRENVAVRQAHGAKVERILVAVRSAFPSQAENPVAGQQA